MVCYKIARTTLGQMFAMKCVWWNFFINICLMVVFSTLAHGKVYSLKLTKTKEYSFQEVFMEGQVKLKQQRDNMRGNPGNGYSIDIEVGTPGQKLNVLVDTGSSNFAIASAPNPLISTFYKFNESSTYVPSNKEIKIEYTEGKWNGVLGKDVINLPTGPEESFTAQIASILESENFFINGSYWQGILGLGYKEIARPDSSVEPFFDSLVRQTNIDDIFAIQLCGIEDVKNATRLVTSGSLTMGGIDTSLIPDPGKIYYTPLRKKWFYEVVITNMKVDNESLGLDCKEYNNDKTIVDSGTTSLRLPEKVLTEVVKEIKAKADPEFLKEDQIPEDFWTREFILCRENQGSQEIWNYFPSLTISLQGMSAGEEFELLIPPRQYLRLVESGDTGGKCYKFGMAPSVSGTVLGVTVMEGFYVVFDRENGQIGFAASTCAKSQCLDGEPCNEKAPAITGVLHTDATDCAFTRYSNSSDAMAIVGYIMLAICILCFTPLILMYLHLKWRQYCMNSNKYRHMNDESISGSIENEEME